MIRVSTRTDKRGQSRWGRGRASSQRRLMHFGVDIETARLLIVFISSAVAVEKRPQNVTPYPHRKQRRDNTRRFAHPHETKQNKAKHEKDSTQISTASLKQSPTNVFVQRCVDTVVETLQSIKKKKAKRKQKKRRRKHTQHTSERGPC